MDSEWWSYTFKFILIPLKYKKYLKKKRVRKSEYNFFLRKKSEINVKLIWINICSDKININKYQLNKI
jgi:hypothetical protein